jgi:hypothetical protein
MRLTPEILAALDDAVKAAGGVRAFERKSGISAQNVSRYRNGVYKEIEPRTWRDLEPHLRAYLPKDSPLRQSAPEPVRASRKAENKSPNRIAIDAKLDQFSELQLAEINFYLEKLLASATSPPASGLAHNGEGVENVG